MLDRHGSPPSLLDVAIARALIGAPSLLLADEPTGNLDSRTGTEILDLLAALRAEHAMTVLVATHEQHVAAACDRLIRLRDGEVVQDVSLAGGEEPEETLSRLGGPACDHAQRRQNG
ncbi:hypothetical protein ACFQZ4_32770 [Catellatospora coxensis]